jgi:aminomethyltransferase
VTDELQHGPLHDAHTESGATFAEFGGWLMPVAFGGTVGEHIATREAVGLFDVSHLGKALLAGPGAAAFANRALCNDLAKIAPGQAQYTLALTEDGGVIDDLIAYLVSDDEVFLVPNAANTAAVVEGLIAAAPSEISITNQHRDYAVLAVQGPRAREVVSELGLPAKLEYMSFADGEYQGLPVRVCRSGYTGEKGYELLPRWDDAPALWAALLEVVVAKGGQPAGLGARDTLRTEMGYPLHGHELGRHISPLEARTGWAVGWNKPEFWGREQLLEQKAAGPARKMWGLKALGKGVPRRHMLVARDGAALGEITSGTFSPTLKTGIALALFDATLPVKAGDRVDVDVRGRALPCEVVNPPFVDASPK